MPPQLLFSLNELRLLGFAACIIELVVLGGIAGVEYWLVRDY